MGSSECSGCRACDLRIAELERRNAELEQRVAALEARLGTNSSNSSLPPSANPLGAPKPVVKKKSKRKPGGQAGHPPHLKHLLPPEQVSHIETFVPKLCEHCHATLPAERAPGDPEPTRFQTIELPPVAAVKHADETSWKLAGVLCWLWAAATTGVVAFVIHAKRSAVGLAALFGAGHPRDPVQRSFGRL